MDEWLRGRLADVPPELRRRIERAVTNGNPAGADEALRAAATRLLREAATAPASRETALTLLTADALMTYACEAAAERQPERMSGLQ